jgi:hypothetical protein
MSKEYQNRQDRPLVNPSFVAKPITRMVPVYRVLMRDTVAGSGGYWVDTEMPYKCDLCRNQIYSYDDLKEYMNTGGNVSNFCAKCFDACHKESK